MSVGCIEMNKPPNFNGNTAIFLESFIPYLVAACLLSRPLYLLQIHQFEMAAVFHSCRWKKKNGPFTERRNTYYLVSHHATSLLNRFLCLVLQLL